MSGQARKTAQILLVAALAVGVTGCDIAADSHGGFSFGVGAKAQDTWTRSYPVTSAGRLEIININGTILAESSSGSTIEIQAERTARGTTNEGAADVLKRIEMREEVGEGRVRVEVRLPRTSGFGDRHEIKWIVKVPKGVAVDLRTVNGGVKLTGLDGDIRARATNGGIAGVDLAASGIDASVTNGGVDLILAAPPTSGTFDLESVNGGVALSIPADSKADISARAVNGGIEVNGLQLEFQGSKTRNRMDGKLNGGGARIQMETVNGGVRLSRTTT